MSDVHETCIRNYYRRDNGSQPSEAVVQNQLHIVTELLYTHTSIS